MRTLAMIVLAAIVGFGVAWLLLARAPEPVAKPSPAVAAKPTPAPVAQASAPPPAIGEPAPSPTSAPPPPPPPKHEPPPPVEAPPEAVASVEPGAVKPEEEPPPAPPEGEPADDAPADDGKPPIDTDRAADLIADQIAREEAAAEDANGSPEAPSMSSWKTFEGEQPDPDWSERTAQQIEEALGAWIDSLPEDVARHIAIVHLECRTTLCQILAADNDTMTQNDRAQAGQEWQQAIATLPQQPWWAEFGFDTFSTEVSSSEGHTLYITYLHRIVKDAGS